MIMEPSTILLFDVNSASGLCDSLRQVLESSVRSDLQIRVTSVADGEWLVNEAPSSKWQSISELKPSIIFVVSHSASLSDAAKAVRLLRRELPQVPIVAVAEACEPDAMLALLAQGASNFITPPLRSLDVVPTLCRLLERTGQATPTGALKEKLGLKRLIGESPAFLSQTRKLPLVARCDAGVLIVGETGTGKEVCARAIHYLSPRSGKPFIPINCGAIPVELVENELFGHEREAFTGAASSKCGLIHEANGGTLFMDEIDCLPLLAQVKLLRFLQEKEYRQLGSIRVHRADVRVIAASNGDLEDALSKGKLRRDLYYRLNVIPLSLPPLREREEDIPILARHFLSKYSEEFHKKVAAFSPAAIQILLAYDWPGNVRELEHVVERAIVMNEHDVIGPDDISLPCAQPRAAASFQDMKAIVVARFERTYIASLLRAHQGNISRAARAANKDPRSFRQLIRKHRLDVQSFKLEQPQPAPYIPG
jgi:DNA-binding NtrC family response regulator